MPDKSALKFFEELLRNNSACSTGSQTCTDACNSLIEGGVGLFAGCQLLKCYDAGRDLIVAHEYDIGNGELVRIADLRLTVTI